MDCLYDEKNVFLKIIAGQASCKKVYEDEHLIAFHDINPQAPLHVLVVPKEKFSSFHSFMQFADQEDILHFFNKVRDIAEDLGLSEGGYRVVMNHKDDGGQVIYHFHAHIIGGKKLGKMA